MTQSCFSEIDRRSSYWFQWEHFIKENEVNLKSCNFWVGSIWKRMEAFTRRTANPSSWRAEITPSNSISLKNEDSGFGRKATGEGLAPCHMVSKGNINYGAYPQHHLENDHMYACACFNSVKQGNWILNLGLRKPISRATTKGWGKRDEDLRGGGNDTFPQAFF